MLLIVAILSLFHLIFSIGCSNNKTVPPEAILAQQQEADLWRAEAPSYLPDQYAKYKESYNQAQRNLLRINSRFPWFRDYRAVQTEFANLLKQGEELNKILNVEKEKKAQSILDQLRELSNRLETLSNLTLISHFEDISRINLTKAEIVLNEAKDLYKRKQFLLSERKLWDVETYLMEVENKISSILNRYRDLNLILKWKRWAKETVEESREKDIYCVLIIKSEKRLVLYKGGKPIKHYPIGLGKRSWLNKRHAKDHATPEGRYRIIGKNPRSKFYKALLINYPNENDRREFSNAKKKGLLEKGTTIGGLIEIHGGGHKGLTDGCISVDNVYMEELYSLVDIGTPVTIIGALGEKNSLSSILTNIQRSRGQENTN